MNPIWMSRYRHTGTIHFLVNKEKVMSPKNAGRALKIVAVILLAVVFYAAWIDLGMFAATLVTTGVAVFGYAVFGRRSHSFE